MNALGVCSIAVLDRPLDEACAAIARAGAAFVEVTDRPPHDLPGAGTVARACGLEPLVHGSYLGLRDGLDADTEAQRARSLGASIWRVWAHDAELVRKACDAAPDLTVVVERHIGSRADIADACEALLREVDRPNCGLNYQPLDRLTLDEARHEPSVARRLARHTRYVHVKNYRPADGRCEPWGGIRDGVLDWAAIFDALSFDGPVAIEFLGGELADELHRLEEMLR